MKNMKYKLYTLEPEESQEMGSFAMKPRLSIFDMAFVFGLVVPLFLIHCGLKLVRISKHGDVSGFFALIDVFKSDIFLHAAFAFLGLALFGLVSRLAYRIIILLSLQIGAAIFTGLENGAHNFFMITGSTLDFQLIAFTVDKFQELKGVLASESSHGSSMPILMFSVLTALLLPLLVLGGTHFFRTLKEKKFFRKIYLMEHNLRARMRFGVAAILLYLGLAIPSFATDNTLFAQNFVLNIFSSYFEKIENITVAQQTFQPPVQTFLKAKKYARKRNVAFIILESTRARSTSIYNENTSTTPFLKSLAKRSIMAERAYSIIPRTSKSMVPIHCGIEPRPSMRIKEVEPHGIPAKCLPRLLREAGYATAYFQTATEKFENRRQMVGNIGFEEFFPGEAHNNRGFEKTNYFGYEDRVLLASSLAWHRHRIKSRNRQPFMVTYLTNTTHHLYGLPRSFKIKKYHSNHLVNKYMNTIRYVDGMLKDLIAQYKKLGIYDDTVFVFVADHGEGLWEHGHFGHSNTIYEEGVRIPLFIHDPRRFHSGKKITYPAQQIDILPTVVDLMGYKVENGAYRGFNLLNPYETHPVRVACWHESRCVATYHGDLKYIHHFGKAPDQVFNLIKDPLEKNSIAHKISGSQKKTWKEDALSWYRSMESFYRNYQEHAVSLAKGQGDSKRM